MTSRADTRLSRHLPERLTWLFPVVCAAYAVAAGRDANWDLLNYHYYNVHAWLSDRDQDVAVAQLQTWFNPLLHLPLYLGMEHLPSRLYAALLGGVQGLNLVLVYRLARLTWPAPSTLTAYGPLLVAATAGCGAAFLTQIGTSFGDTLTSLPLLGALFLVVGVTPETSRTAWRFVAAGLLAGAAVGLKPLAGIYAVALAAAVAIVQGSPARRLSRMTLLAAGGLAGVTVAGGWWYWHVAQLTGNPLFPYYNDIFQAPLYWDQRFTFTYFLPQSALEAIFYPWIWLVEPTRVSEMRFLDLTIPALMTLAVVLAAARALGLRPLGPGRSHSATIPLTAFWAVAYVLWLTQSAVYRFAVVLEMTAPLLIVALLARWVPVADLRTRIAGVLLMIMVVTWPANFGRFPFADRYLATSPVDLGPNTMVLVAGWAPLSYMVRSFPAETPLVRIQSNMHGFTDRPNGMDRLVRERVAGHAGPLVLLLAEPEWPIALPLLDREGYHVERSACRDIDGALAGGGGVERLNLCPVTMTRPDDPATQSP